MERTAMTDEDLQELRDWFGQNNEEWCGFERNALVNVALSELATKRREVCRNCKYHRPKTSACAITTWSVGDVLSDDFTDLVEPKGHCHKWEPKV